ncbi:unnamed protein product [Adineta ricciae]|uniref:Uncharacterized protein n=1 Tax=Adineta ricciae TaxID=249248 RepID=A0A813P609_ADIRI|nr:unnamed protein product [Adineta ricciae]CAF1030641.1 unnamed protein product [Adineta ricciae]
MIGLTIAFISMIIFLCTKSIQIGFIQNVSLTPESAYPKLYNGSCEQCVCAMINSNKTIVSLNCYRTNSTCHLFGKALQTSRSYLNTTSNTTFYFLQLPPQDFVSLSWSFDGTFQENLHQVDTVQVKNVSFASPGIYGRGSALALNGSQYLITSMSYFDVTSIGFTFEMWIYANRITNISVHQGLVGQCIYQNASSCLHISIKSNYTYLGFYNNDCAGITTIYIHTWYHVAFVYNATSLRQTVFVDGKVSCNGSASALNPQGSTPLTIGTVIERTPARSYSGYLDQLSFVNRPKFSSEILNDATLVFYFAFKNGSFLDSGSNGMLGTPANMIVINDTLLFNQTSSSFEIETFMLVNKSLSVSLWINPFSTNNRTIVHTSDNFTSWDMIAFDDQNQLTLQTEYNQTMLIGPKLVLHVWTHIVQTYFANGSVVLYINGTLYNQTESSYYPASCQVYTMILGDCVQRLGTCNRSSYEGFMDDVRVYTRNLDLSTIQSLRNDRN